MSIFPDAPELLVLGSGAAGFYCALAGARAGMHTVLVEKAELGGTAFRWGCLPVKMALDRLKERSRLPGAASRRDGRCLRAGDASVLSQVTASLAGVERRLQGRLLAAGVEILHGGGERLAGSGPGTW
jgi:dihydrolipoamide dehydrogenase